MSIIKKQYVFIIFHSIISIIWIIIPESNMQSEVGCFEKFFGNNISYFWFNKFQFYFYLIGTFFLVITYKKINYIAFICLESILVTSVIIKVYIYNCGN